MTTPFPAFVPVLTTEAARILEVSPETVRHWERVGILPALKTERGVRLFDRRDVERLARERQTTRSVRNPPAGES
jgi:excisionase family DNA binding protein